MKTIATVASACAVICLLCCPAAGELCTKCKNLSYTADVGKCVECGGLTTSGAFKLCKACSAKLGQCEHCRTKLRDASPATAPEKIDREKSGTYTSGPWQFVGAVPAPAAKEKIDREKSGTYTSGRWRFVYEVRAKGSRSERRSGELYYWTKKLPYPAKAMDYYQTPWGKIAYSGRAEGRFGAVGWSPAVQADLKGRLKGRPLATPNPGKIDPKQSKTYEWGKWKYVYRINQKGTPQEGYNGSLLYDGKAVPKPPAVPTNDYYETPWGKIYWTGQPNMIQGQHEWMPSPRAGAKMGKLLPDPAADAGKDLLIEEASDGKTVTAVVGQKIVIRLASPGGGPTPPPKWTATLKGDSLRQEGRIRLRARRIAGPRGIVGIQQGGPLTLEAAFRATKVGKTTITLEARPWRQADAAPIRTFTVTVDVQAKAGKPKPHANETLKLTEGHDGKTVVAKGASKVLIELPSAPPPGVGWQVIKVDGDSLKQIGGLRFGGLKGVDGPGGIFASSRGTGLARLTFGVVALGKTTISLQYRAKGPGRPIRTYSVIVDVQALPPDVRAPGAPGKSRSFPLAADKATVRIEYRRPWMKNRPAEKTFDLTVEVKSNQKSK